MKIKLLLALLLVFTSFSMLFAQVKKKPTQQKKTTTASKKVIAKKPVKKAAPKKAIVKKAPVAQQVSNERLVEIATDFGVMIARLSDSTPLHRDNFIKLVESGFYDSLLFHRVIDGFMIQGGDPDSKNATDEQHLGMGKAPGDRVPAEFNVNLYHKKGALAAARDNNPEKASSNCQFYIVQGKPVSPAELDGLAMRARMSNPLFNYTPAQKEVYKTIGGTPFLDQNYTVFGELTSGLDVLAKISKVPKGGADRPLQNVRMKMRMLN